MHTGSAITLGLVATGLAAVSPALALTCSDQVCRHAANLPGFEVIAKKARGNWRAQVRALPSFGALYAN